MATEFAIGTYECPCGKDFPVLHYLQSYSGEYAMEYGEGGEYVPLTGDVCPHCDGFKAQAGDFRVIKEQDARAILDVYKYDSEKALDMMRDILKESN